MKWSAPGFTLNGKILLIMVAFKEHAALNFWRGQEIGDGSPKAGAMGQLGRLTSPGDLPPDAELDKLIREAAELSKRAAAPRRPKHAPPGMHPEFAATLAKAPKAKAVFDAFPPSAQRDYLEWIAEAKQDVTRARRIATAVEWLSEGKRRNWKYEKW